MNASLKDARAAKGPTAKVFGKLVGDVAVGVMRLDGDRYGLKVNLTEEPPDGVSLPSEVEGVPIRVEVVGRIRKR
jgi:hypothetical protein